MEYKKRQVTILWAEDEGGVDSNNYHMEYDVMNGDSIVKTVSTQVKPLTTDEYATLSEFLTLMDSKMNALES